MVGVAAEPALPYISKSKSHSALFLVLFSLYIQLQEHL